LAVIATAAPEDLRRLLSELRQQSHLPASFEYSFHKLSSAASRRRLFGALARWDFESWAMVVDKTTLPDTFRVMNGMDFYLYFVTELIQIIPAAKREGATLILDEFGSAAALRAQLKRFVARRGISLSFKRVLVKRSKSEPLIQIADLIAGAILRRDSTGAVDAYDFIAGKLTRVVEFGTITNPPR
jgi:hypothetical protein